MIRGQGAGKQGTAAAGTTAPALRRRYRNKAELFAGVIGSLRAAEPATDGLPDSPDLKVLSSMLIGSFYGRYATDARHPRRPAGRRGDPRGEVPGRDRAVDRGLRPGASGKHLGLAPQRRTVPAATTFAPAFDRIDADELDDACYGWLNRLIVTSDTGLLHPPGTVVSPHR